MKLDQLREEVLGILRAHSIPEWEELSIAKGLSHQFIIKDFGIVVCVLNVEDIAFVRSKLLDFYKDWSIFYITTDDDLIYKQDELLFELMRNGYMKWIRLTYPREFNKVIKTTNLGNKIIRKRLDIWEDKPKYSFLIRDNEDALKYPTSYVLTLDPGFFDYMPQMEV